MPVKRIDGDRCHGWQVFFLKGDKTTLFSDSKCGGNEGARLMAIEFEKNNQPAHYKNQRGRRLKNKVMESNMSGHNGVHRTHYRNRHSGELEYYWASSYKICGKQKMKTFLIHKYGELEAKNMAIQFRKHWEKTGEELN